MKRGIVIKSTGSWYHVRHEDKDYPCRIIGKFRLENHQLTNPVAVGDEVEFTVENTEQGFGIIKKILPRKNYVVRQSPRKKHALHLIASNVDMAILIVTIVQPKLKLGFIDRFLLMTEPFNIPTTIVFNKSDLYSADDRDFFDFLKMVYTDIGYDVLLTSATTGEGLEAFKKLLHNKTTLLAGQSGVGKSSLVNRVAPKIDLKTQELSDYSGKGQHTTTFAEMYFLEGGGALIDSPGIKTLTFNYLEPQHVAHNFREIFEYSKNCKFGGSCLHRNEPKCAVKAAVAEGYITEFRYENYLYLLEEIEKQNYWERH